MDFYSIKADLQSYLLLQRDANGLAIFSADDFTNQYSNISTLLNFESYAAMLLENKMRMYKDNSVLSTVTDFNLARQLAKIQGYAWNKNRPSTLNCRILFKNNTNFTLPSNTSIVIPKFTSFDFNGVAYYLVNEVVVNNSSPEIEIQLQQGTVEVIQFVSTPDQIIVLNQASSINETDVFVDTDVVVGTTTVTQSIQYYPDEQFLDSNIDASIMAIYYPYYYNDNVVIRFNEEIPAGKNILVVAFRNDGYLTDWKSIDFSKLVIKEFLYNSTDISTNFSFKTATPSGTTYLKYSDYPANSLIPTTQAIYFTDFVVGKNADTIDDIKKYGSRGIITRAVNENDFKDLMAKEFNYKTNAIGGEKFKDLRYLGYVIFTGVNESNEQLSLLEIQRIKTFLDGYRGLNIRPIYMPPTVIGLDFEVDLQMKVQYKGRYEEYKTSITNSILTYVNTTIYSDIIAISREFLFNNIFLQESGLLDFVDKLDIIVRPYLKLDKELAAFMNEVAYDGTGSASTLFTFGATVLSQSQVYNLYKNIAFKEFTDGSISNKPYVELDSKLIYANMQQIALSDTAATIEYMADTVPVEHPLYKIARDSTYYNLKTNIGSSSNDALFTSFSDLIYLYTNDIYYSLPALTQSTRIYFDLYKTDADKHSMKDMKFSERVFVITNSSDITFVGA